MRGESEEVGPQSCVHCDDDWGPCITLTTAPLHHALNRPAASTHQAEHRNMAMRKALQAQ